MMMTRGRSVVETCSCVEEARSGGCVGLGSIQVGNG